MYKYTLSLSHDFPSIRDSKLSPQTTGTHYATTPGKLTFLGQDKRVHKKKRKPLFAPPKQDITLSVILGSIPGHIYWLFITLPVIMGDQLRWVHQVKISHSVPLTTFLSILRACSILPRPRDDCVVDITHQLCENLMSFLPFRAIYSSHGLHLAYYFHSCVEYPEATGRNARVCVKGKGSGQS